MSETTKRSLLLVEDDFVIAYAEQRWLKEYGYDVKHVLSGQEAVDYALSGKDSPDLILMDINLGEGLMDGTEAAGLILEQKDIPIVFLSSHTEQEIVAKTESITSYGYVVKDSGITVLDASIKMAFRLFESRQREKEKDQALINSENRFRRAMEGSMDGLWDWDLQNDDAYFSDRFSIMLGYSPGELPPTGEAWYGLLHPDDRKSAYEVLQNYLDRKTEVYDSLFRMKTKSGEYRWIQGRGKAVWDGNGEALRITGVNTDVTDSHHSRAFLQNDFPLYTPVFNSTFDNAKEGIIVAELDTGSILYANPQACRLFRYTLDQFRSLSIPELHEPGFFPHDFPMQGKVIQDTGIVENIPCKRKDGEIFFCDRTSGVCRQNDKVHIIGYFYDRGEQKASQSDFVRERNLFTNGPVSLFLWLPDEGWPVSYVSDNVRGILGYEAAELMSGDLCYANLIHPQDRARIKKEVAFYTAMGENSFDQTYRIRHKNGEYLWVCDFTRFCRDENGQVREIIGYMFDQSRLKEAEDEILKQKERLSSIIAGTNLGTWEWNLKSDQIIVNEQWAAMLGYGLEELGPVNNALWRSMVHKDDLISSRKSLNDHLEGKTDFYSCEIRLKHKNGSWIWILEKGKVTEWTETGDALWIFGTQQDITERKKNEEAIQQQLAEKEILLREVHHRIKNNMNSVSSLLKLQADLDSTDGIGAINKAIGRLEGMRVLYDKLLFTNEYKEIAVKPYLEDLIGSIEDIFPEMKNVEIDMRIDDVQLKTKEIFPLGLIVNELITNSMKYAFAEGASGVIKVVLQLSESGEINLKVSDNGIGLPYDFSLDSNAGFGLMLVKMLTKQLEGDVSIESRDGVCSEICYCSS